MAQALGRTTINGTAVDIDLEESPLAWLARRGMVTGRQLDAGEQLRRDFETASLAPSVTMRWDAAATGPKRRGPHEHLDPSTAQIAAKARFEAAVTAAGPGLSDILWRVVCAGEGLTAAERALGWPTRSAKLVLGLALDRVASHYGMR